MRDKIAFVKTGWSESYQGEPVLGRHAHISKYKEAHERFNFLNVGGLFYGYLPPIGRNYRPPQPKDNQGWLVIFVAARNGNGPLTVVGWYDNATFEREYCDRPEYESEVDFETDVDGGNYGYCVSAPIGNLIPPIDRKISVPGDHFKRTPILYVKGNGSNEKWRQELAKLAVKIVKSEPENGNKKNPTLVFPDKEHKDKVEKAAIEAAFDFLEKDGYRVTDRQKDKCGYDLLARRKLHPVELHVEVKGTSNEIPRFFMSRNEKQYIPNPKWRLFLVTDALKKPKGTLMTAKEVANTFDFNPFAWEAVCKKIG